MSAYPNKGVLSRWIAAGSAQLVRNTADVTKSVYLLTCYMAEDRGYEVPLLWNCCGIDYLSSLLKVCSYPSAPLLLMPTCCFFLFSLVLSGPSPFLKRSLPSFFSPSNFITNFTSPSLHTLPHFQKERLWK